MQFVCQKMNGTEKLGSGRVGVVATLLCFVLLFAVAVQGTFVDVVLALVSAVLLAFLVKVDSKETEDLAPEVTLIRSEVEDLKKARFVLEQSVNERFTTVGETLETLNRRLDTFEQRADEIEALYLKTEQGMRTARGWAAAGSMVAVFACVIPFLKGTGAVGEARVSRAEEVIEEDSNEAHVAQTSVSEGEVVRSNSERLSLVPSIAPIALPDPVVALEEDALPVYSNSVVFRAISSGEITVHSLDGSVKELSFVRTRG